MKRISLCWLAALLGVSLGVARGESPRAGNPVAEGSWPQIVRSGAAEAGNRPGPKVYYFDVTGSAAQRSRQTPAAADGQVRPAAAALHDADFYDTEPASLDFPDPALPIEVPPQPPKNDRPPGLGGADALPPPYDAAPPLLSPGMGLGLGGIPTFTHDYCPVYWDNPWQDYCWERWQRHCGRSVAPSGRVYQTPADLGEEPTSCCQACQGADDEAPPPPALPAIVPDRAPPRNVVPDRADEQISAPPNESPTPSKRRLPRNEIPQAPK